MVLMVLKGYGLSWVVCTLSLLLYLKYWSWTRVFYVQRLLTVCWECTHLLRFLTYRVTNISQLCIQDDLHLSVAGSISCFFINDIYTLNALYIYQFKKGNLLWKMLSLCPDMWVCKGCHRSKWP